jgi:hypothetical protein
MTDDRDAPGAPREEEPSEGDDTSPSSPGSRASDPFRGLDAFSAIQRELAAVDFTALTAAQRAIEQATAFKIPEILAAQDAVAKHFAGSIDFSRLASTHNALINAGALSAATAARTKWADSLAKAVDFTALRDAVVSSTALTAISDANKALTASIQRQTEVFARIAESVTFKLPAIDVAKWVAALDRWIPVNLRAVDDLDAVATVALDEGLPLSWVPRREIVVALVSAGSREERHAILIERTDEILDDCNAALTHHDNEWARQCRNAIGALRAGFDAPAQSHASNIIDSIVLALHGKNGRDEAKKRAEADFDDLPMQLAAENLTLRPLFRAFTAWWPTSGDTPPDYFARHATSHAVGHVGVFAPLSALIAVMLATSLTVQYSPDESTTTDDDPDGLPDRPQS